MNKIIASSGDPKQLSATVQGMLMALVPLAIALFQLAGVEVAQTDILEIVQQISAVIAAFIMAFGLVRKAKNVIVGMFKR